jgi:glycosyltransferase involved in cell wall biosynthesis
VIHNGADHTRFYQLPKSEVKAFRERQSVGDKFVLLTVGSVSRRKGQEVVIRALPEIKREHPNIEYWMAGLPVQRSELEILAADLGVEENLRFLGRVSNEVLLELYNACDLFVMTSRQLPDGDFEGYGIAVIEAALCGKAAVVSANSGLEEAVQDGLTGLIVPQNDPDETAEAVLRLIKNPDLRKTLAKKAYQNASHNQTWDRVAEKYMALLEEVMKNNKHS